MACHLSEKLAEARRQREALSPEARDAADSAIARYTELFGPTNLTMQPFEAGSMEHLPLVVHELGHDGGPLPPSSIPDATTAADIMDAFFAFPPSGGTSFPAAHDIAVKAMLAEGQDDRWNRYTFHITDGEPLPHPTETEDGRDDSEPGK